MYEIGSMTEDRAQPTPELPDPGPRWLLPLLIVVCVLMVAGVLFLADGEPDDMPADIPAPSSSATTWSEECTAEDLDDGACYTWDDIRDAEWHSQTPSPTMTP